jgi:hypothetical protein
MSHTYRLFLHYLMPAGMLAVFLLAVLGVHLPWYVFFVVVPFLLVAVLACGAFLAQRRLVGQVLSRPVLRLEPRMGKVVLARLLPGGLAARTGQDAFQEFPSADGKRLACLREAGEHVVLGVEVAAELLGDRLMHFEIRDTAVHALVAGFVGLYAVGNKGYGEVLVDRLAGGLGGGPERMAAGADLFLLCESRAFAALTATDRELLERSLRATDHPDSRAVLQEALRRLETS